MKTYKARILLVGPCNAGKTKIANYLADLNMELPEEMRPTNGLRIVEYDISNADVNGSPANIDVQIWDASGDEKYMSYWSVFRKNTDGIVFVYAQEDDTSARKLDYMYNYFVTQPNKSLRSCLVCGVQSEENNVRLSMNFSKLSKISANIEDYGEKLKQEFTKYIVSVVNNYNN